MKNRLVILVLFFGWIANGQAPKRFFTKFGGDGIDDAFAVKQTLDKQYIVAGSTTSFGNGNSDFLLLRIDSMGKLIWQKNYGGFLNDVARGVIQLADTGYVITGFTNSFGSGGYDILTIRTDKFGTVMWQRSFGGGDWDYGFDLVESGDGGIVVCGSTASFGNGKNDAVVIKYDMLGNLVWQKFFGGTEDDDLRAVIKTNDNMLAFAGMNKSIADVTGNGYFIKLNNSGDTLFTRNFGGFSRDFATDLVQIKNNDYIVVGAKTFTSDPLKTHSYMIFYNSNGIFKKDSSFYHSVLDENYVGVTDSPKDTFCVAYLRNVPVPNFSMDGNLFVQDKNNLPLLVNSFGGYNDETLRAIDKTKDKGFVSVGLTKSFGAANGDVFFIKQDSGIFFYDNVIGVEEIYQEKNNILLKNLNNNVYEIETSDIQYDQFFITDLCGKKLLKQKIEFRNEQFSISNFTDGIYFLTISSTKAKSISFKLIKN